MERKYKFTLGKVWIKPLLLRVIFNLFYNFSKDALKYKVHIFLKKITSKEEYYDFKKNSR